MLGAQSDLVLSQRMRRHSAVRFGLKVSGQKERVQMQGGWELENPLPLVWAPWGRGGL